MALRRRQSAQFNFQIRKNEIDPEPLSACPEFHTQLQQRFCPKLRQWLSSVRPYTVHCSVQGFLQVAPPPPPSYMSQNSFPFNPQHTHPLHAAYVLPMYLLCLCVYAYLLSLCISCLPACLCIMPAGHSGGRGRPAGSGGARRARLVRARGGGRAEGVEGRAGRTMDVPCSWVALSV